MTDPIRAALERLVARLDETTDPNGPVPAWSDSFYAARAALSADGPAVPEGREPASVVGEPSDAEWAALVERAWDKYQTVGHQGERFMYDSNFDNALEFVRRELARYGHQPAPPTEGEVVELVADELVRRLRTKAATEKSNCCYYSANLLNRAADLIAQRHPALPGEGKP